MGFWEFMTVVVVFSSVFGYLRTRHTTPKHKRIAELEKRVAELEAGATKDDLHKRLAVLEDIVVTDDHELQRRIAQLEREEA